MKKESSPQITSENPSQKIKLAALIGGYALTMGCFLFEGCPIKMPADIRTTTVRMCDDDTLYGSISPLEPENGITVQIPEGICTDIRVSRLTTMIAEKNINGETKQVQTIYVDDINKSEALSIQTKNAINNEKKDDNNRLVWIVHGSQRQK